MAAGERKCRDRLRAGPKTLKLEAMTVIRSESKNVPAFGASPWCWQGSCSSRRSGRVAVPGPVKVMRSRGVCRVPVRSGPCACLLEIAQ